MTRTSPPPPFFSWNRQSFHFSVFPSSTDPQRYRRQRDRGAFSKVGCHNESRSVQRNKFKATKEQGRCMSFEIRSPPPSFSLHHYSDLLARSKSANIVAVKVLQGYACIAWIFIAFVGGIKLCTRKKSKEKSILSFFPPVVSFSNS